jgi:hypothetical protein
MAKTGRPRTEYAEKMGPVNHNVPLTRGGLDALRAISVRQAELGHSQPQWMIVEQALYRLLLEVCADPQTIRSVEGRLSARWPEYMTGGSEAKTRERARQVAAMADRERILQQKSA